MRRTARLLVGAALAAMASGVSAQGTASTDGPIGLTVQNEAYDPELERRTEQLASQLRCPVCQGLSVEDSPTELALQMRAVVREQLAAGRSPEEVKAYFVDKYGEWILLEPKAQGFNLVVYILPWLAVALGIGVIVVVVRRWTAPAESAPPGDEASTDPLETATRDF